MLLTMDGFLDVMKYMVPLIVYLGVGAGFKLLQFQP